MRPFILLLSILLAAPWPASSRPRPNIIVVMADDMGFSDPGCYGGEIRTPVIDRLASEGVRFSQFYNASICGPSRASLMTGCYPWQVGQVPGASVFANLTPDCVTLPQLLKANGYKTAAVGRLDMVSPGNWHDPVQVARCVDRFLGSASGGPGNHFKEVGRTPWFKDGERWERPDGPWSTDLITGFAVDFILESDKDPQPFFIYVSHYAPHWPLQASEEHIAPYRRTYQDKDLKALMTGRLERLITEGLIPDGTRLDERMVAMEPAAGGYLAEERMAIHAAMVEGIDRSLGEMLDALAKVGKLDNTLILVLSDNGASSQMVFDNGRRLPDGVRPGSGDSFLNHGPALAALGNTPFRNFKTSYHEGGIASPLIAWWPRGLENKGRISHRPSHIADIMPTCLELAGVSHPGSSADRVLVPMVGKSFVATLGDQRGEDQAPRVIGFAKALREGDWKLVIENPAEPELYNLADDRNERNDLADQEPGRVRQMIRLHREIGP